MDRNEIEAIERRARMLRAKQMGRLATLAFEALARLLVHEPAKPAHAEHPAERFMGLASFQDRLKNSRPPRIAVIRSTNRSKCSGTSTKFRRSLFTMSSGLSE
jgi:hypothetical protein